MRTSLEPSQSEVAAFERFFKVLHPELDTTKNGQLFGEYLLVTWGVEVNETTLNTAWAQLKDQLEVLTPARVRYDQVGRQDLKAATELYNWYVGNQKILVKDGDPALENMTKLLLELRGRQITPESIHQAIGRVGYKQGLHYTPIAPQRDPRGHTMEPGESFMKKETSTQYSGGKLNHAYQDNQKKLPETTPEQTDAWSKIIEGQLADGTHGQQQTSRELYTRLSAEGLSPRQISTELQKLKRSYKRLFSARAV